MMGTMFVAGASRTEYSAASLIFTIVFFLAFTAMFLWPAFFFGIIGFTPIIVNEQGIAQRSWMGRRCHWPWELFRSGKIQDCYDIYNLRIIESPKSRHVLRVGTLPLADANRIQSHIASIRPPRQLVDEPREAVFRTRELIPSVVTLNNNGITVSRKDERSDFAWREILGIELICAEASRLDFRDLTLRLPDRELVVKCRPNESACSMQDAERIAYFIKKFVPHEKIQNFALYGEPRSIEELDLRRTWPSPKSESSPRTTRIIVWLVFLAWLFFSMYQLVFRLDGNALPMEKIANWVALILLFMVTVIPVFLFHYICVGNDKERKKQEREHQQQRKELLTRLPLKHPS